jgi:hypothetical protein
LSMHRPRGIPAVTSDVGCEWAPCGPKEWSGSPAAIACVTRRRRKCPIVTCRRRGGLPLWKKSGV